MPALCIRRQYTTSLHKGLVHFRSHIRLHSVTFSADYLFLVLIRTFSRTELHKYTDKYHSKSPSILCWYKKWLIAAKVQAGWYQRVCTDVDEQPVAWILTLHVKYRLGQIWVAGKLVPATKMILILIPLYHESDSETTIRFRPGVFSHVLVHTRFLFVYLFVHLLSYFLFCFFGWGVLLIRHNVL